MDGYVDFVDTLLGFPSDKKEIVEEETKVEVSPLGLVIAGDVDGLAKFLKDDPNFAVNARNPKTGRSLLHEACARGDMELVKMMLQDTDADLTLRTMLGRCTALHLAVANNYRSIVFLLLSHGADVSSRDRFGCSPMHYVKSLNVTKLLIQYGAKVLDYNAKKKHVVDSVTSFMETIRKNQSIPAVDRDTAVESYRVLIKYLEKQAQEEYRIKLKKLRQLKMQPKEKPTAFSTSIHR